MKRYAIVYDRRAEKQLRAIRDRRLALALQAAIDALSETPRPPGCLKMSGPGEEWRIRVGDWRIVYRIEDGRLVVVVVRVAPRSGVYG
ncbi:MAG: type II toxin-antitoxin system RelE/ParE family toxin [Rhodobacterales bacterium]|nr:type II toxin-antitoxin system RelE/ParE family toxin [Rhodobacterales bacterium]